MSLEAVSQKGLMAANIDLSLDEDSIDNMSQSIPLLWDKRYNESHGLVSHTDKINLIPLFPWLLGILGGLITLLAINLKKRPVKKLPKDPPTTKDKSLEAVPESFWHQPTEKVERAIPFSVEKKKKS